MSKQTDERATPWELFNELNQQFNFTLDVCASAENHKCDTYFSKEENGLKQLWSPHICFMNPPYSEIYSWLQKANWATKAGALVVAILPMDGSTQWFHHFLWNKLSHTPKRGIQLRFPDKRYKFGDNKGTPKFATLIAVMYPRHELDR